MVAVAIQGVARASSIGVLFASKAGCGGGPLAHAVPNTQWSMYEWGPPW